VTNSNLTRLLVGGLLVAGGYTLWRFLRQTDRRRGTPTSDEAEQVPPSGFLALERSQRLERLIERIKTGDPCFDIQREMRGAGAFAELQELWIELLERHDAPCDDPNFKEQLLYIIRDGLEPDCPLLERLFAAYRTEPHPYTRMRIVRAVGRIGGDKARAFLEDVRTDDDGMAAEEAGRWLRR